jgi:hypothetical protein
MEKTLYLKTAAAGVTMVFCTLVGIAAETVAKDPVKTILVSKGVVK